MSWRGLQESRWCGQRFESWRTPAQFPWITFGVQNCRHKMPVGWEIRDEIHVFPGELQPRGSSTAQPLPREGCTRGESSFVGIYCHGMAHPVTATQRMPHFENRNDGNTHNTSGQPRCTAPPRWTRRWSSRWGLCPAGRRGFPAPGVELQGWARSSLCSSFLHRKPWLCNLLSRWDTGRGGEGEEGELELSGHKSISAGWGSTTLKPLRWGFTPNHRGEKRKKEMSGIILILGTLLHTSPFSCPFLSTVFLKGFSSQSTKNFHILQPRTGWKTTLELSDLNSSFDVSFFLKVGFYFYSP